MCMECESPDVPASELHCAWHQAKIFVPKGLTDEYTWKESTDTACGHGRSRLDKTARLRGRYVACDACSIIGKEHVLHAPCQYPGSSKRAAER